MSELRDRHAAWYIALGERACPELRARRGREWHDRLDAEHANLRAALEHLLACQDRESALRLSGAIWHVLGNTGALDRGPALPVSRPCAGRRREPRAPRRCILGRRDPGYLAGRHRRRRTVGDAPLGALAKSGTAACRGRGSAHPRDGRDRSRPSAGVVRGVVGARSQRGRRLAGLGRPEQSRQPVPTRGRLRARDRAIRGEPRDRRGARRPRPARAGAHAPRPRGRGLGDLTRARAYFRSGLAAAAEIGLIQIELDAVWGLASYEAVAGDVVIAARLVGWVNEQIARLGASADVDDIALEESLRDRLGAERLSSELAPGAALTREDAIDLAARRIGSATAG